MNDEEVHVGLDHKEIFFMADIACFGTDCHQKNTRRAMQAFRHHVSQTHVSRKSVAKPPSVSGAIISTAPTRASGIRPAPPLDFLGLHECVKRLLQERWRVSIGALLHHHVGNHGPHFAAELRYDLGFGRDKTFHLKRR